ncbi:MAG: Fe-S cluster assembly protein NifU [bacterium]
MWEYSDKVLEHFYNPRNMGEIEDADGIGEVGSIACGDMLKLYIKVDENGIITDAKFKTFGCGSAIASASALTELIIGMPVKDADSITNEKIAEYLGGLPREKMHCSVLGREALEHAIADFKGEKIEHDDEDEGVLVCKCFGITEGKIRREAIENNLRTVEDITNFTKAGGACGTCIPQIEDILLDIWKDESVKQSASSPPLKTDGKMTNLQKINLVQETVEREIRPQLKKDGGDIDLIDVEGNLVKIAFRGHCAGCMSSQVTLKGFIEQKLREFVTPEIVVEQVTEDQR